MSSTTIPELGKTLQALLIADANELGRTSGFIQRQRKLSGASFVQALLFGWQASPQASLEDLCQSAAVGGVDISPQGLSARLRSPQAAVFLRQMLERSLGYLVAGEMPNVEVLKQFSGIYLQDSTTLRLPVALADEWRASGNQNGRGAGMKVQTVINYSSGQLALRLVEARAHDSPLQQLDLPAGSLRLADVGYFKAAAFETLTARGVGWLTRLPARVQVRVDGRSVALATWFSEQIATTAVDGVDTQVEVTGQRLRCRLIARRVPDQIAAQRRQAVMADAARRRHALRAETLALCDWLVLVTNLPPERLSASDAVTLLRLRWQIELLFKLWKSTLALTAWRSHHPHHILTEVFAKLLLAVVHHWLLLVGCWGQLDRSLFKAARVLRKHAFQLAAVLSETRALISALRAILRALSRCLIQKRKARPATFQLLERVFA